MFLEVQGFTIETNILFQYNQIAVKIEWNGKASSEQKTKHMGDIYIWIMDKLQYKGIKIEYCPIENMIAEFFTKPLQGDLFKKFRDIVIGFKNISTIHENDEDQSYKECVGKDVSEGDVKRNDDGLSVIGGTQLGNIKRYDDGPFVVGSTQHDMSYSDFVSKW